MSNTHTESYFLRQREQSHQHEARKQTQLKTWLGKWADPDTTFWSMLENRPRSAKAGVFQKRKGVRSGIPDLYVVHHDNPILESPGFAHEFGSCGEAEVLHLAGVLTFDDEFREDVVFGGIQEKFRQTLA